MDLQTWGGRIWGSGANGAWDLIGTRSAATLRQIPGLTIESATKLRDFFQGLGSGKGGIAPGGRVELLNHIIQMLGG
jgi:hypothetical protein